jgi:hypothetical protein
MQGGIIKAGQLANRVMDMDGVPRRQQQSEIIA